VAARFARAAADLGGQLNLARLPVFSLWRELIIAGNGHRWIGPWTHRMNDATPLIFAQLGPLYDALLPWAEMLLRAVVGLTLVPHGLRSAFGMFPSTGGQSHNLTEFVDELDRGGYRPAKFWAPAIVLTQLVAGPMLAFGLLTRLAACPIVIFLIVTNYERWRVGGFFWNKMGLEFTLLWTMAVLYFLVHGGGAFSVDHLVVGREF
jgi:putative oxidoreductase